MNEKILSRQTERKGDEGKYIPPCIRCRSWDGNRSTIDRRSAEHKTNRGKKGMMREREREQEKYKEERKRESIRTILKRKFFRKKNCARR